MDHVSPFAFNGVRFLLGSISLLPLILYYHRKSQRLDDNGPKIKNSHWLGFFTGTILFIAASLQQIGLIYTTAGKAAFITCLYIILVPIAGLFLGNYVTVNVWLGSLLAVIGLYFLCIEKNFTIAYGDSLELIGAFFWTAHILLIDRFARKTDTLKLAFFQFLACSLFSLGTALLIESISLDGIRQAAIPILYSGVFSVGVAYTLQIVGQKHSPPAYAAIILSMETVFAALGGYLILGEQLSSQELLGCTFMLGGMVLSQWRHF